MSRPRRIRTWAGQPLLVVGAAALSACLPLLSGCVASGSVADGTGGASRVGGVAGVAGPATDPVVAYIRGAAVAMDDLRGPLLEAAGAEVFRELVIERAVDDRLAAAGVRLGGADIARELDLLSASLSPDADTAARLLRELRQRRGLGDDRFDRMLRRSAGLRKLVADDIRVTDAEVAVATRLLSGPRVEARLITLPDLASAKRVRAGLVKRSVGVDHSDARAAEAARARGRQAFAEAAMQHSTDASAARGGLLAPVHPEDPSYPAAIRRTLANLPPGAISEPIALDPGFGLLRVDRVLPGRAAPPESDVRAEVRRRSERVAMQRLAEELLDAAEVTVVDPDLGRAWRSATRPGGVGNGPR